MQTQRRLSALIHLACGLCSAVILIICLMALVGWTKGINVLVQVRADYIPMAPNTLICFSLMALAMLPFHVKRPLRLGISLSVSLFVGFIALTRLSEFLLGAHFGVDQWFFKVPVGKIGAVPIGYMSFPTVVNFLLACVSFTLLNLADNKLSASLSASLALTIVVTGGIFTLGYLYGAPLLYGGNVIPMALNTSVCFVLLGVCLTLKILTQELARRGKTDDMRRLLAAIVASSEDAIIGRTPDGIITVWNKGAEALYGYAEDEIIGHHISALVPPEHRSSMGVVQEKLKRGEQVVGFETTNIRKDGRRVPVALTISPVKDHIGRTIGVSVISRDISQNKQIEETLKIQQGQLQDQVLKQGEALVESERRFATLINEAPDPMVTLSSLGFIESMNQEAEKATGYRSHELFGKHFSAIGVISGVSLAKAFKEFILVMAGKNRPPFELEITPKGGVQQTYEANSRLMDLGGKSRGILVVFRNISERRRLEQQLLQAQKMEAIGLLAGGIAHDFNNHLSVILGTVEFIAANYPDNEQLKQDAEEIKKAAQQSAGLTRQLLAFSRRQVLEMRCMNLNDVVTDTEKMLRRLIGEHIELAVNLRPDLLDVKADPGQIEQVIINLVVNARDAMPKGGRLVLETANVDGDAEPYVKLTVRDSGVGMAEETAAHIFEPFFTTKASGKGTGLGLSTVYGIVNQSGGRIEVETKVGAGTAFHVFLPALQEGDGQKEKDPTLDTQALRGSETILLVEDEKAVRDVAMRVLTNYGYSVLPANSAGEALQVCEHVKDGGIDLVLTDMVMPHMTGLEMVNLITAQNPGIKILFMSGYADPDLFQSITDAGMPFLTKPIDGVVLARKIREVLGRPSQA